MKLNSRYVFGAALALAGLSTGVDGIVNQAAAAPITAAGFTFEGLTGANPGAVSSFSYAGEAGGTVTLAKTATVGSISTVAGNGSSRSLSGNNLYGGTALYSFAFSIDGVESLTFAFDTTGSNTGPRDFVVSYSLDGTSFSSLSTYFVQSTGGSTGFSAATFSPNVNKSFVLPAGFSDLNPLAAGDLAYLRIAVLGTAPINSTVTASVNTGGTNRIDNVLITGSTIAIPEPASAAVLTLAAAGLVTRRRKA